MNPALNNPFDYIRSSVNSSGATRQTFFIGDSDMGNIEHPITIFLYDTPCVFLNYFPWLPVGLSRMSLNNVSSRTRLSLSCMVEIILNPLG